MCTQALAIITINAIATTFQTCTLYTAWRNSTDENVFGANGTVSLKKSKTSTIIPLEVSTAMLEIWSACAGPTTAHRFGGVPTISDISNVTQHF